jgi:hypothetical protein
VWAAPVKIVEHSNPTGPLRELVFPTSSAPAQRYSSSSIRRGRPPRNPQVAGPVCADIRRFETNAKILIV